ncbi:hypothetical protein ASD54_25235 [Rhizobium sp. Root149]|uniref:hypothetical protein n=1 Tax=Rhizobium TaxID=379 RepID=UPI000713C763|nr:MULTISPECIES: hypothetical protein [Rhizobium]KQZ56249.1 hypothetical protein ASD54_25235 [Rhizobium sp. Root149]
MTKDDIPAFIEDILATGCPVTAVGHDSYVFGEIDVPEDDIERVSAEVHAVCQRYGGRDHLLLDIVAHLRSLGRYIDLASETVH